jgi:hypothetical protein
MVRDGLRVRDYSVGGVWARDRGGGFMVGRVRRSVGVRCIGRGGARRMNRVMGLEGRRLCDWVL